MKLFTCFHPQKKHVRIRCWNLDWRGKTWPFSRHGSTLQDGGDQALNGGAALFTHFAWNGTGETLAHGERGEHKKARANANSEKVASLQHPLFLAAHLNPFTYHMVSREQACDSSHICFNCLWLSSPFGTCTK